MKLTHRSLNIGFVVVTLAVLIAWVAWALAAQYIAPYLHFYDPNTTKSDPQALAGQFGDSFGPLGAFFSGLAMAGAITSLVHQQITQRDQDERYRKEREQATADAALQAARLTAQEKQLHRDRQEQLTSRFETSFFELLRLARELRGHITTDVPKFGTAVSYETVGADVVFKEMERDFLRGQISADNYDPNSRLSVGDLYLERAHNSREQVLGPYFRTLYTILRRISTNPNLSEGEKISYGNLVRAQLTSAEIFVIGLNGVSSVSGNFSKYLDEFRLFKYLPEEHKVILRPFYDPRAFDGRVDLEAIARGEG